MGSLVHGSIPLDVEVLEEGGKAYPAVASLLRYPLQGRRQNIEIT